MCGGAWLVEHRCVFCKHRCVRQVKAATGAFASLLLLPFLPAHRGADYPTIAGAPQPAVFEFHPHDQRQRRTVECLYIKEGVGRW